MKKPAVVLLLICFGISNALPWLHHFEDHHNQEVHFVLTNEHLHDLELSSECDFCDLFITTYNTSDNNTALISDFFRENFKPVFPVQFSSTFLNRNTPPRAPPTA